MLFRSDFGIAFGETSANDFYSFNVDNQQNYWLRQNEGGRWTTHIDLTRSAAIRPNSTNQVTVVSTDGKYYFFINDQFVDEYEPDGLVRGRVGMVANLYQAGVKAVWQFDNFELRVPWIAAVVDTFDAGSRNWELGSFDFGDVSDNFAIADGKYVWSTECRNEEFGCVSSTDFKDLQGTSDFELSVDARRVDGPLDGEYGVRFHDDGLNYIEFLISDEGRFTISLWYESSLDFYFLDNPTWLIDPGGINRLGIIGVGPNYSFYINGLLVGEIAEELLPFGGFELAADLDRPAQLVLEFDNFKLRVP